MSQDLKLASTEDLLNEVASRAESGVLCLCRDQKTDKRLNTYKLRWFGDPFKASGLAAAVIEEINYARRENEDKITPEEF